MFLYRQRYGEAMTATALDGTNEDAGEIAGAVLGLLAGSEVAPLPRHRHQLSRDDVRKSQIARILASAIELFADQGYAETKVLDIAKRAGVSRKTFYELYDSKEDVFLDTYRAVVQVLVEGTAQGADEHTIAPETLPAMVESGLALLVLAPAATRMFFLEALGAGSRVRARRNEAITEFVAALTPPLRALRAEVEPDLPMLSSRLCHAIAAAIIELIVEFLVHSGPEQILQLAPEITQLIAAIVIPNHYAAFAESDRPGVGEVGRNLVD